MRAATWVAVLSAVALVAASVSSGASTARDASQSAPAASSFKLSEPLKLAFLWQIQGETANGINDFQYGAEMAVQQINAAGGVGGKPIQVKRTTYSATDPQAATTSFLAAAADEPDVIIGFVGPTVDAVIPNVTRAGIPSLGVFEDGPTDFGPSSGSPWFFNLSPKSDQEGATASKYLVQKEKKKKVGIIATNDAFGAGNSASATAALKKFGLKPVAVREVSPAASDLTPQLLAMDGADALQAWLYPNGLAALMNESVQNGIELPTIDGPAALIAVAQKLVPSEALSRLFSVSPCNPTATNAPAAQASFVKKYEKKYGETPSSYAPLAYDGVNFAVAAVNAAKSTSPDKVKAAMSKVNYTKGVCAPVYKSDPAHILNHQFQVSQFAEDSTSSVVATYPVPPAKAG